MYQIKLIKKSFLFFLLFFCTVNLHAQTGIFFQAIARDNTSNPAKDRKIYVQTNIIQSSPTGTMVLTEEHQTYTDAFGIFSIMVGNGTRVGGTTAGLSTIDWSKGPYYLNLKIVITPIAASNTWDYSKEWVDIGTTIFGTVPFALYSANTAKIDEKLNVLDTSKMLVAYAKAQSVQALSSTIDTKLATKDTVAMLAPYAKQSFTIDSNFLKNKISGLLVSSDTVKFTKKNYTDSALRTKMNVFDTSIYAKQAFVDAVNYAQQKYIDLSLQTKLNLTDTIKFTKQSYIDSTLLTKMNNFDTSIYAKQAFVDLSLQSKFDITDTIKYTKKAYTDSALITKLNISGSAAGLTNFPILNQNTTGNAATATYANSAKTATTAETAGNITATNNTTLTSLSNLNTVGTITTGVWNGTVIDIAHGGTGLMTAGIAGQLLTSTISGTLTWTNTSTIMSPHYLGESFGGGIVFYVYDNGKHGLIVSTEDQSTGVNASTFTSSNCCSTTNAIRDGINAGISNTERIIVMQGSGNYAALIAANYKGGGYGDWYLPSIAELKLIILNSQYIMSTFINPLDQYKTYWSSNENPINNKQIWANYLTIDLGNYIAKYGNPSVRVRAIRSF